MPSIARDIHEALQTVQRPGDFYTTGRSEIFAPELEVAGVGPIALPLLPMQAEQLIAVSERAPYGRGEDTLVDTEVRRTWQIGADRIRIGGRHWSRSLTAIVDRCATGLGVAGPVSAQLYKMLVYDAGSFFVGHRDTEKAAGMFATLVIVLPSKYTGGELVVRHGEREACLDLPCPDAAEAAFAAFYADCVHQIRPITSGCRLALVYNLIRQDSPQATRPPAYDAEEDRVATLLRGWAARREAGGDEPEKLIYPLEHVYTPAALAFDALKNADAARAAVLAAAADRAGCQLHLALVAIEESGTAEYADSWPPRRGHHADAGDEGFEAGEVCERTLTLSDWRRPDGIAAELPALPFEDHELCPPDAFAGAESDEQLFFEATGNAGASFERSYRRAALVLWQQSRTLEIVARAGLAASLPYLQSLIGRRATDGDAPASPARDEARRLAGLIVDTWPKTWDGRPGGRPGDAARLLASVTLLQDRETIAAVLARISAAGCYDGGDNPTVAAAVALLPPERAAGLIERIIARNGPWHAPACAELLARCAAHQIAVNPDGAAHLLPAAVSLVADLPGDPARASTPCTWLRPDPATPALVVDLLDALHHLDALPLAQRAVDHLLARPDAFHPDTILVPAAVQLAVRTGMLRCWPPAKRLVAACVEHLDRRLAEPLTAPTDFARPSAIACRCAHCVELAAFLADPRRKTWAFRAAEAHRQHVEESIRRHDCDVDAETDRHGRPYALVCTKNQKSYQRRVAQRDRDLRDRAQFGPE